MPRKTCHLSTSLDGFAAGPDQSRDHPTGADGLQLLGIEPVEVIYSRLATHVRYRIVH